MLKLIGIIVLLSISIVGCSKESEDQTIVTEKEMIVQETDSTNELLSDR